MNRCLRVLSAALLTGVCPIHAQTSDSSRDARVDALMPELGRIAQEYAQGFAAPGVAIAVVTPDHVRYLTFGLREIGQPGAINQKTIFQLASVSKPITSTLAAKLVSDGRLHWSDPVPSLLPWFTFADQAITRRTTVANLLSQRSGLPGGTGDFLETLGYDREFILRQMRYVDTSAGFEKQYAYSNFGITTGGVAAAASAGLTYDAAVRKLLFRPAGMRTAFLSYARLLRTKNRAALHFTVDGVSKPLFVRDAESEAPGGGVNASVQDMAAFLQLHLNRGHVHGRSVIDPEALRATYQPLSKTGEDKYYGLCWNVSIGADGKPNALSHSGAFFAGSRTAVSFWPPEKVGIVVLSNSFPSLLPEAVSSAFHQLYDRGTVTKDTLRSFQDLSKTVFSVADDVAVLRDSVDIAGPINGVPLSAYVGVYGNKYLRRVEVTLAPDPQTGHPTLWFRAGPHLEAVKIRRLPPTGKLVSMTPEGDSIEYHFQKLEGSSFHVLTLPALKPIGWPTLDRLPR